MPRWFREAQLAALFCALTAVPSVARATLVADWSLSEVLENADSVVVGTVVEVRLVKDARGVWTETVVAVERQLKGKVDHRLVVSQIGGVYRGTDSRVVGDVRFAVGQRRLLATHRNRSGRRFVVGLSLGAFRIEGDRLIQSIETPLMGPGGRVQPAPGLRAASLATIESLLGAQR